MVKTLGNEVVHGIENTREVEKYLFSKILFTTVKDNCKDRHKAKYT
jgi:hypothetical protein